MTAYNVVRFRVKPGNEEQFVEAHRKMGFDFPGVRRFVLIKTGDRSYCVVGEWNNFDSLAAARPQMIARLDTFRDTLEDLGGGLGVTDPVSGEAVVELTPKARRARPAKRAAKKPARKARKSGRTPARKPAKKKAATKRRGAKARGRR